MINKTQHDELINNIKKNAKYLKLSYSFHNVKELIEEHSTLNSSIVDFYDDLLQKEADIRYEKNETLS